MTETNNFLQKQNKKWPFIKQSFNIDFSLDSCNRIIFQYANFFNHKIDFIITLENQIRLGIGHLTIADNADFVKGAGRIIVNNYGYILYIDNKSGHYIPKAVNLLYAVNLLKSMNFNMHYYRGTVFDYKMEVIKYMNETYTPFSPKKTDIDFETQKEKLKIEIPINFDWEVYKNANNLYDLNNQEECINHYQTTGYLLGYKISKNPNYYE